MSNDKNIETEKLTIEEKRLLSIVENLKRTFEKNADITYFNDLINAETRLLLLRRKLDYTRSGRLQ